MKHKRKACKQKHHQLKVVKTELRDVQLLSLVNRSEPKDCSPQRHLQLQFLQHNNMSLCLRWACLLIVNIVARRSHAVHMQSWGHVNICAPQYKKLTLPVILCSYTEVNKFTRVCVSVWVNGGMFECLCVCECICNYGCLYKSTKYLDTISGRMGLYGMYMTWVCLSGYVYIQACKCMYMCVYTVTRWNSKDTEGVLSRQGYENNQYWYRH